MESLPRIGMSMGDPAGVGPEISVAAALDPELRARCVPILYGSRVVAEEALGLLSGKGLLPAGAALPEIVDLPMEGGMPRPGRVDARCGRAADQALRAAAADALAGKLDAVCTAPLHKEALKAAGVSHPGHTEILAEAAGLPASSALTMFETGKLRIFFFSRHLSLKDAVAAVKRAPLAAFIIQSAQALAGIGVKGAVAVAGLNPHCGDGGLFGDEEATEIAPAVADARASGIDVQGPIGADSVFHQASKGAWAAVISLYHDQGHIAAKTLDFFGTVSVTLGLPFLRTSPDHGTAFDIAWQGKADPGSMKAAMLAAARYSRPRA